MATFRWLIRLSRPFFILEGVFLYFLGAGIAHYLGGTVKIGAYLLGQVWVSAVQLSMVTLLAYFNDPTSPLKVTHPQASEDLKGGALPRPALLWIGLGLLIVVCFINVIFIYNGYAGFELYILMGLILIGAISYSVPPIHLEYSGYGELIISIMVASFIPALAYLLQMGGFHRILLMTTFPLVIMHLGMMIALELPEYGANLKYERRELLVRVGWQRGMLLHNIFILGGFVLLGIAIVLGLPVRIGLPAVFALPLGIFQVWRINRIADGASPFWNLLRLTAVSILGLTLYLLAFGFWTR